MSAMVRSKAVWYFGSVGARGESCSVANLIAGRKSWAVTAWASDFARMVRMISIKCSWRRWKCRSGFESRI